MSVFRNDHAAAVVRVQVLEAEVAHQRTQLAKSERDRLRLAAELDLQTAVDGHAPPRPRPPAPPRSMTIGEWILLAGFLIVGQVLFAIVLEHGQ